MSSLLPQFSEMYWQGADGSRVLGFSLQTGTVMGNEIPVDKEEALTFWKQKLADVRDYASNQPVVDDERL